MSDKQAVEDKDQAPAMKASEPAEVLEVTSHETAETALKDSMDKAEKLRAALLGEEAAKNEPDESKNEKHDEPEGKAAEGEKPEADEQKEAPKDEKNEPDPKAEVERLKAEQRRKDGIHGSELEKLRKQVEILTGQLGSRQDEAVKGKPIAEALEKAKQDRTDAEDAEESYEPTEAELVKEYGPNYEVEVGREWAVSNLKAMNRKLNRVQKEWDAKVEKTVQAKLEEARFADHVASAMEAIEAAVPGAREIDANATTNGFAEYLDSEMPENPGFTRREVAERLIASVAKKNPSKSSLDRLINIYAGFAGKEPKNPADGADEAMRAREKKKEPSDERKETQPDKEQYVMPTQRGADKNPNPKSFITVSSYEEELRKNRGGNFDATVARLLEKVRAGEVISG